MILITVIYLRKSKKTVVVERDQVLPPIPKRGPAVQNSSFDMAVYEEPCSIQPDLYDTKKLEREQRARVASESLYHVEADGYLDVTEEGRGATSI